MLSTVFAALIGAAPPAVALWLGARPSDKRPRRSARHQIWGTAGFVLVAVTIAAGLLAPPLGWVLPPVAFMIIALGTIVIERRRAARRPLLDPVVRAFADRHVSVGGYPYDQGSLPDLIRVYTGQELTDAPDRDAHDRLRQPPPLIEADSLSPRRESLDTILSNPLLRHVVVTGEGGIGKTSLLAYLSWIAHQEWKELSGIQRAAETRLGGQLPIQIPARAIVEQPSVAAAFGDAEAVFLSHPPAPKAQWLVMIDALDEIGDADDRRKVVERILAAMDEPWPCRFIITTRGLGDSLWRGLRDRGTTEFRLQPFTREQLFNFLVANQVSNRDRLVDPAIRTVAEAKAIRFLNRVDNVGGLIDLLSLPLLARVAATIYFAEEGYDDIPARRVDIYRGAVDHWLSQFRKRLGRQREDVARAEELLRRWTPRTRVESSDPERLRSFLAELAHRHLEDGHQLVTDLAGAMLQVPNRPRGTPDWQALHALLEATGLIYDADSRQPRFLHKTFAEYLSSPLRKDRYGDVDAWARALQNADERPAAVFACNQLSPSERRTLALELSRNASTVVAAGWLVAEGLCVSDSTDRADIKTNHHIIDALFDAQLHHVVEGWDAVIAPLASGERTRDRILKMISTETCAPYQVPFLAELIARYDGHGVNLLRDSCYDTAVHDRHRIDSAERLMIYDSSTAKSVLRELAENAEAPAGERVRAAQILAKDDPGAAIGILHELASKADYNGLRQVAAAEAYTRLDQSGGVPILRIIGQNPKQRPYDRARALAVLAEFDKSAAVQTLTAIATDAEEEVETRIDIAASLSRIDSKGISILLDFLADENLSPHLQLSVAVRLLTHRDSKAISYLTALGSDRTANVYERLSVALNLSQYDRPATIPILRNLLTDAGKESDIRSIAAGTLAYFGDPEGVRALREMVGNADLPYDARIRAAEELGGYDRSLAIAFLREAAHDPALDRMERANADFHFQKLSPEPVSVLAERVNDSSIDGFGRVLAADALAERHWRVGVDALVSLATSEDLDGCDRLAAAKNLAEISEQSAIDAYECIAADEALADTDRLEAAAALEALAKAVRNRAALLNSSGSDGYTGTGESELRAGFKIRWCSRVPPGIRPAVRTTH
jgi:ABC-type transporter Mla MlaB component